MTKCRKWLLLVVVASVSVIRTATAQEAAAAPSRLVPIPPCRLLDTVTKPAENSAEEPVRRLDLRSTRCSRAVPSYATMYSLRITTYSRTPPEKLSPGVLPLAHTVSLPATPGKLLDFPVPGDSHIAVDVVGYYVAPGTPVSPVDPSGSPVTTGSDVAAQSILTPRHPVAQSDAVGTKGQILLDNPPLSHAGILMTTLTAPSPWIYAKGSTSDAGSGFAVANSANADLMRVRSDGRVQVLTTGYFSGHSDYLESASVPTNIVHNVTITNPRDSAGGNTMRVIFFNARSEDENGSPSSTKYLAYTKGYFGGYNINYDSHLTYHNPNQYHYRAWSTSDGWGKETFWVKGANDQDSLNQTRADMYVSGKLGIGVSEPQSKFEVKGTSTIALDTANNYIFVSKGAAPYAVLPTYERLTVGFASDRARIATETSTGTLWPMQIAVGASPGIFLSTNGRVGIGLSPGVEPVAALHVAGDIHVTGNINAKYQDVAEWVPASVNMPPGTVVVLNGAKSNEVMPSAVAYDTAVAGVVSAQPGLLLGEASSTKEMIATTGRVKVHVSAVNGAIGIGDLLVSSEKSGMAMRSNPIDVGGVKIHRPGTIIGKALEPLASGEGEILVLLSLQ